MTRTDPNMAFARLLETKSHIIPGVSKVHKSLNEAETQKCIPYLQFDIVFPVERSVLHLLTFSTR